MDTVEPSKNRLKVYARCSATNLSGVVSAMTLGDHPTLVSHPGIQHAIANVTHLWCLMFGQDAVDNDVSLSSKNTIYTKGIVVYYDLTPGRAIPMPKVYIPVRHYANSDAHVCQVMSQYYRDINFIKSGSTYQQMVEQALYVIVLSSSTLTPNTLLTAEFFSDTCFPTALTAALTSEPGSTHTSESLPKATPARRVSTSALRRSRATTSSARLNSFGASRRPARHHATKSKIYIPPPLTRVSLVYQ